MSVITFKAVIKNGIIEIPEAYKQALVGTEQVEITILTPQKTAKTSLIAQLIESPIEVEDFTPLTREAAHDRRL